MNVTSVNISSDAARKLLATGSGDAAIVYLYIQCGNDPQEAEANLNLSHSRFSCAAATLRQLGLWPQETRTIIPAGERPNYSERDVIDAMGVDKSFKLLCGEVERLLGKALTTEELKILLGFHRYLGLGADVICVIVNYCKDRMRQRGSNRTPSLRTIEKEAYAWAERGIDTVEEAAAFIQTQNAYNSRVAQIKHLLQIRGRWLTAAEERYVQQWIQMGFDDQAITMAYERTCLNTGGLKWPYMNSILKRWHQAGLHTGDQVESGDRRQSPTDRRDLDADELAAIQKMMQEV